MTEKYLWNRSIFRNVTGFNKVSLHFKKIPNSLRKVLQTYSEICIFYVIQYIEFLKQSMEGALKVLEKIFENCFGWSLFYSQFVRVPISNSSIQSLPFPRQVICHSQAEQLPNIPPPLHTSTTICIFSSILSHS